MASDAAPPRTVDVDGYRLVAVYGRIDADLHRRIQRMWVDEGALPPDAARRRVDEVVVVMLAPGGEVAGVNTAYVSKATGDVASWYCFRTFVRAAHRGLPLVVSRAFTMAVDELRAFPHPHRPVGLLAILENPKLSNAGPGKRMERLGLRWLGQDRGGRQVWGLRFDGEVPSMPAGLVDPARAAPPRP